jgi:methionyl-tRNA formyltransferase
LPVQAQSATDLRIVYAGTPDFAVPPLQALISNGLKPVAALTQPDRPAGRGRKLQGSPVKGVAEAAQIPVFQPTTLRDPASVDTLARLEPDLIIVVAYGLILPREVLALPTHGCWNIHASLLPRWRGAAPIQRAIEAGDAESGVCVMQMDEGLDTGPVLRRVTCPLAPDETGGSLHDKLAQLGARALLDCLGALRRGAAPVPRPQPAAGVSYARKLLKAEAEIDWHDSARLIERRIRAFNPWPVAFCEIDGERTRIWAATVLPRDHRQQPGTVLNAGRAGIEIACGEQILRITQLQRPGGRVITAENYLNARPLPERLND